MLATPVATCDHGSLETLGWGGRTTYLRCRACASSLVEQGGMLWVLRAIPRPAP